MALEATQEAMLKELEDMSATMTAMGKAQGVGADKLTNAQRKQKSAMDAGTEAEEERIKHLGKSGTAAATLAAILKKAGQGIGLVATTIAENIRMTRGFDSNINNASYAMQHMAANSKGVFREFYKMGASTVDQLQEQFDVYKRLSSIGGVTGDEFSKMRERAATMGLTMEAYAGLMEENFLNLRLGGNSAKTSMKELGKVTKDMRNSGSEFNDQFLSLGVDSKDYGKMIMQNSMLMGGFSKAQKDSANYAGGFNQKMLDTTKVMTAMSEAFGFNREQAMKSANDALKSGRNRAMYNSIEDKGKEILLASLSEMFGDPQKAMEVVVGTYTGQFTDFAGLFIGTTKDIIPAMKEYARLMVENPKDLAGALAKSGLGQALETAKKAQMDQVRSTYGTTSAFGGVVDTIQNMIDFFGDSKTAQARIDARVAGGVDKQLNAYGNLTRENIAMAIMFAETNEKLNDFGIGIATMTQLMALTMGSLVGGGIGEMKKLPEVQKLLEIMEGLAKKGSGGILSDVKKEVEKQWGEWTGSANTTGERRAVIGNRNITVQGRATTVDDMFSLNAEATGGKDTGKGKITSMAVQQLVAAIAENDDRINVTATNDTVHKSGYHPQGQALDFTLAGMSKFASLTNKVIPDNERPIWAAKAAEVRRMLIKDGLKENDDFLVLDEANYPNKDTTGPHIHVQFTNQGRDKYETKKFGGPVKVGNLGSGGATNGISVASLAGSAMESQDNSNTSVGENGVVVSTSDVMRGEVNRGNRNSSITTVSLDQDSVDAIVRGLNGYYSNSSTMISNALYYAKQNADRSTYTST
jgi:hypothetical protein